jgi:hypothetical protein
MPKRKTVELSRQLAQLEAELSQRKHYYKKFKAKYDRKGVSHQAAYDAVVEASRPRAWYGLRSGAPHPQVVGRAQKVLRAASEKYTARKASAKQAKRDTATRVKNTKEEIEQQRVKRKYTHAKKRHEHAEKAWTNHPWRAPGVDLLPL